jgi:hypothetical protein
MKKKVYWPNSLHQLLILTKVPVQPVLIAGPQPMLQRDYVLASIVLKPSLSKTNCSLQNPSHGFGPLRAVAMWPHAGSEGWIWRCCIVTNDMWVFHPVFREALVVGFELHACMAGTVLLEPLLQPFLVWLFWRQGRVDLDPPVLHFLK